MSKPRTDAERAEMYRRQLGGTNAALRRMEQRAKDAEAENARLIEICAKYQARCEELERQLMKLGGAR